MNFDRKQELNNYQVSALVSALDNTGVHLFMYYPQTKSITVPENACEVYQCKAVYENMPQSFADDFVHEADHSAFNEMYYKIDQGEKTATAVFHSKDLNFCHHVTLTTVSWTENGKPEAAVGVIEDISDAYKSQNLVQKLQSKLSEDSQKDDGVREAMNLIADIISDSYRTLYHVWLNDLTYVSFQDEMYTRSMSKGKRVPVNSYLTEQFIEKYIEPEYQAKLRRFFSLYTLADRLRDADHIEYTYRRKKFGWTKAQFFAAKRDADGKVTNVIFTVRDINAEVINEEKKKKTEFELLHDPLTTVYNRKAFEELDKAETNSGNPIGFAVIDIDNFKIVNDAFGHEAGDRVLVETAKLLQDVLRSGDTVFRIGGDEFAVLLRNCTASAWDSLCEKQHQIHAVLDRRFKKSAVTLSIGLAFSANGYNEEVFRHADEQLYDVKRNGRSGCSMIDIQTGQIRHWRDESLSIKSNRIMEINNTGLYRIEYPLDNSSSPRLICGDITREIFGFSKEASSEECYRQWLENIDPAYLEILGETRQALLQGKQAECTYRWNHPALGKIFIRTSGFSEIKDGVQILNGYHHSMKDTMIMERKDDKQLILDSMSAIYFCSYYIDLDHDCFYTLKNAPGEKYLEIQETKATDALNQFLAALVSPDYLEKMTTFMDFGTLRERLAHEVHLDCEYLSRTEKGWCRATYFPVKYDADGRLTHVLFVVTSLDEQKSLEAKKVAESRKSIEALYNNVPGGIIMYEWNGRKLKTLHISAYYEKEYGYTLNQGTDGSRGPDFKRVHPDDLAGYQAAIMKALNETHELHYDYRVWNQNQNRYLWTHIDATSEVQADGTSLIYAIYTDVTAQKSKE